MREPILAAIGAGIPIHAANGQMIVDIGGGHNRRSRNLAQEV